MYPNFFSRSFPTSSPRPKHVHSAVMKNVGNKIKVKGRYPRVLRHDTASLLIEESISLCTIAVRSLEGFTGELDELACRTFIGLKPRASPLSWSPRRQNRCPEFPELMTLGTSCRGLEVLLQGGSRLQPYECPAGHQAPYISAGLGEKASSAISFLNLAFFGFKGSLKPMNPKDTSHH